MKSLSEIQFNDTVNSTTNKFSDFSNDTGYLVLKHDKTAIYSTNNYPLINDLTKSSSMYFPELSAYNQVPISQSIKGDAYKSYLTARGNDQFNENYLTSTMKNNESLNVPNKKATKKISSNLKYFLIDFFKQVEKKKF